MIKEIKKMWCDSTTFGGKYVAKDVMKAISFLAGVLLICGVYIGAWFGKIISLEPGMFLMTYALGVQGVKEFAKYKNNAVAAITDSAPQGDNEPPKGDGDKPGDDTFVPESKLSTEQLKTKYSKLKAKVQDAESEPAPDLSNVQ